MEQDLTYDLVLMDSVMEQDSLMEQDSVMEQDLVITEQDLMDDLLITE